MHDLFSTIPEPLEQIIRNGKAYEVHPVVARKPETWAVRWRSLDGATFGVVGGWYGSPELAREAIERAGALMVAESASVGVQG